MDKAKRKLERNVEQVKRRIREIGENVEKDVIDTFSLRYNERTGLQSEPVEINSEVFSGEVEFPGASPDELAASFSPEIYETDGAFVEPLTLIVSPYCTLLATRVGHSDSEYRVTLDWVKKRSREKSQVYLIDPENSEYYYPNSTDLRGEVVAGNPKTGLVAFDPLRHPTSTLQVHFSSVKLLQKHGERESFHFEHNDPNLPDTVKRHLEKESLTDTLKRGLRDEKERVWNEVQQSAGCAVVLLFVAGSLSGVGLLVAHLV